MLRLPAAPARLLAGQANSAHHEMWTTSTPPSLACVSVLRPACACLMAQVAHHGASIVYAKPTPGVLEIEPSMAWNPAVLAGGECLFACLCPPVIHALVTQGNAPVIQAPVIQGNAPVIGSCHTCPGHTGQRWQCNAGSADSAVLMPTEWDACSATPSPSYPSDNADPSLTTSVSRGLIVSLWPRACVEVRNLPPQIHGGAWPKGRCNQAKSLPLADKRGWVQFVTESD